MPGPFATPGGPASPFFGVQKPFSLPAATAGTEFRFALPGGAWYRLLAARLPLTTSAVVGNRNPRIQLQVPDAVLWKLSNAVNVAASTTVDFNLTPLSSTPGNYGSGLTGMLTFYPGWIPGGWVISTSTILFDVGDQWGASEWLFEELDQGPYGGPYGALPAGLLTGANLGE